MPEQSQGETGPMPMDMPAATTPPAMQPPVVPPAAPASNDNLAAETDAPPATEPAEAGGPAPGGADIDYEQEFVKYLRYERNMSPETIRAYEKDLHQFMRFFCKETPEIPHPANITTMQVREFLAELKERNYKTTTIVRKLATIRSFYKFLMRKRHITTNPLTTIETPKVEK
ncbi:MAG: site-specific integrase, partial [Planctomycetes bacterium]|nr:site-specific integrase [Planctomycetota bacterium]